ncbi:acyl-CoA dehydrogenase family protein [Streptomyces odontomachi]|uniref:acyl-CoA dehydrogenase family protein n=1 Tax=Streptomyces odontomachi TaxID=2944940 RepID=UPI00210E2A7A|nr:acyl-CoA dehydrogenase family protein [Streptomyces sp. ODS25]
MRHHLDEDQKALADAVETYLRRAYDFETNGADKGHWTAFAEMGLLGLVLPEEYGGLAAGPLLAHAVMESFGRHLVKVPYASTVLLCGRLIALTGDDAQCTALLPALAAGEHTFALAHDEPHTQHDLTDITTTAVPDGDGWLLTGAKCVVIDGDADRYLVTARTSGDNPSPRGVSLFLVDRDHPGLSLARYPTIDGAHGADLRFDGIRLPTGALLGRAGEAHDALSRASDLACAALCAEAVGAMSAVLDATRDHAGSREQFGSPIGKFQALQHRLVDMLVAVEQARSLAWLASATSESDGARAASAVSAAKVKCIDAARLIGLDAIQLHGGIGMTDELRLGHHVKRLLAIEHTLGDRRAHLTRFMDLARPTAA